MSKPYLHQLTALILFSIIISSYLVMVNWFPVAYIWGTYEDLCGEWGQTYFFAIACFLSLLITFSKSTYRWFFAVLALALFYTFMEEISWGQRIFNIESPDFFKQNNLQRETNLHNILVGPFSTDLKRFMEYFMASALTCYGVIYPLFLHLRWNPALFFNKLGVAAPPIYLLPFFLTGALLELGIFNFNEAEIAELLISFSLAIMAAHYLLAQRNNIDTSLPQEWTLAASQKLAGIILGIFILVALLSATTTYFTYNNPDKQAKIKSRIHNGYEKFAKRYSRYERWDVTTNLYQRVHEVEPTRTSILRRLAMAHRENGNEDQFLHYTNKALNIALTKYKKNQNKISTNLSLARTYGQLGQTTKAKQFGLRAHEIALQRAENEPDSAHWAYWSGKTYRNLKNYQAAKIQFEKAFNLKPSSKKYRRAYYKIRSSVN